LSTSNDQTVKIWDIREGQILYTLHGHDGAVNCAQFSPDSKFIASGSVDSFVMVWEADLEKCLNIDVPYSPKPTKCFIDSNKAENNIKSSSIRSPAVNEEGEDFATSKTAPSPKRVTKDFWNGSPFQKGSSPSPIKSLSPGNTPNDAVSGTLDHIVGQLEIITRALSALEQRISLSEERISDLANVQAHLVKQAQGGSPKNKEHGE
jgi:centriolar protein POC1